MKTTIALIPLCSLLLPAHAASVIHSWDFEGGSPYLDKVGAAEGSVTGSTTVNTTPGYNGGNAAAIQRSASTAGNATVNIAHTSGSPTITTPMSGFSLTFWFKIADDGFTAAATGNRGFFDFNASGTDSGYHGLYNTTSASALQGQGQLNFRVDNGANTNAVVFLSPILTLEDNQWHHIAVTFNPGQSSGGFSAYLDGAALANIFSPSGATLTNTSGFASGDIDSQNTPYLGAYNLAAAATTGGLGGGLDDFQIWSGVLTPSEISNLASVPETSTAALGALAGLVLLRRRR